MARPRPVCVKIKTGVYVNLDSTISYAIEPGLAQTFKKVRPGGDPKNSKDYVDEVVTADTISFYFANDRGLSFRVGYEITREDYNRIKEVLGAMEYHVGDSGQTKPPEGTK